MAEIINTFTIDNPFEMVPMDRNVFYDEQIKAF